MCLGVVSVLGHGVLFVTLCDVCINLNRICDEPLGDMIWFLLASLTLLSSMEPISLMGPLAKTFFVGCTELAVLNIFFPKWHQPAAQLKALGSLERPLPFSIDFSSVGFKHTQLFGLGLILGSFRQASVCFGSTLLFR